LGKWQSEFRKHFNSIRLFNSCQATYKERIELLESLKGIDQDLQPILDTVVNAFRRDWRERNHQVVELLLSLLEEGLAYSHSVDLKSGSNEIELNKKLHEKYEQFLRKLEIKCQKRMRGLFKHNIFNLELPPQSILKEDLFSEKTWEFLGLNSSQIVMAGALSGAALGAGVDVAAAGLSFGIFSTIGGILGAAGTALKGRELLAGTRLLGVRLDSRQLQVGPVKNIQLLFVLLDRQLLFYSHIINWAHGRRDYESQASGKNNETLPARLGYTTNWSRRDRALCDGFFRSIQSRKHSDAQQNSRGELAALLERTLREISLGSNNP
ncbi:MAG TPA: DUF3482 domain-containing protein, partial [Desulfocapsa sulfexigens]|nr:DUF3482 domain-containing protein [Desulfocapsa sulfexigens]